MATATATQAPTDHDIRAARLATCSKALTTTAAAGALATRWTLKRTWRRLLPVYWTGTELALAGLGGALGATGATGALLTAGATAIAAGWPARTTAIRVYRTTVAGVYGTLATTTLATGGLTAHPTLSLFGPALAAGILGWPWWHHLRTRVDPEPQVEVKAAVDPGLTEHWARRWRVEVIEEGLCAGTRLVHATTPRPGVVEATIRLAPGAKRRSILASGPDLEVAFDLDDGSVGWRHTGKAARLRLLLVSHSYIADGVPWTGPTHTDGRCQLTTFTDGTPGHWVFYRPGFGTLNGLVVGSTGAGKSRALGVLIRNLLEAGWMVVIGDPQNGQSLPAWKDAAGEYHKGPEPVRLLIRRLFDEVMRRSALLSAAGVEVFDPDDPRVQALGVKPMAAIVDECQMVLISQDKKLVALVEDLVAICRKTGVAIILATQIPQIRSLGGSIPIRDALVAGNCFIMRLSNRGSGPTVLPDDFVGNPFAIPKEIGDKTTAGMGYLRDAPQLGMLSRVPMLDETEAATTAPRTPVQWLVDPVDPTTPMPTTTRPTNGGATSGSGTNDGAAARLRAAFGLGGRPVTTADPGPTDTPSWVIACLRKAPTTAQGLLDRPDCPVGQGQLYAVLDRLASQGRIVKPGKRGAPYTL